ncbi:hypothetical protein BJQ94_03115 [Cryobacterium sp. SO2]|uniref:hypothetical protein n=1 Tax=Cryobacterium sp. SO2 TaxID=1897060 RepID=UPI00223E305E|nr:hypothetical protein [Cryobacterium sp. SO2]WEO78043.1 hypothetical protein BJQ94_03115 [Cryobacterium sp. SO2]
MTENLLLGRRPAPPQQAVPSPVALPRRAVLAQPAFAARNSPTDLLFRALWQLVGVYVFVVLVLKDHKLPR